MAVACFSVSAADAKKKEVMSALQLQQLQSRDIEASKEQVFGAVMSVLQDSGYRIQAADKDTGLITGIASTSSKLTWKPFQALAGRRNRQSFPPSSNSVRQT